MANKIAALNDAFRSTLGSAHPEDGRVLITDAVLQQFGPDGVIKIAKVVAEFRDFTHADDPHNEHDFAAFEYGGHRLFWKIDYYNRTQNGGSENPADPAVTFRVLTIMLASDY